MAELLSIESLICSLQKCRKTKNLAYAKRAHAHICNIGLESHRVVGNYIVPIFVDCGSLPDAQQVFDSLVYRNVYSWTSLILGYIECGQSQHALNLYLEMQDDSIHPNSHTLKALLKACAKLKDAKQGQEIHVEIAKQGFERDVFVGSTLIDMYAKCGSLAEARSVFEKLPLRNVVSWNALIGGYAEHGPGEEALKCFERMQLEGISPDAVTFMCILKACGSIKAIGKGQEIHSEIRQKHFDSEVSVGNTLVDMYVKCGSLAEAQEIFNSLPVRNVVTWNALIAGYAEHGLYWEALKCFEEMQLQGLSPNSVTFICVLKACGSLGAIDKGQEMHADIIERGFAKDAVVGSTLVDMYAKCGSLARAQDVFDKLPVQNVVSWNALIAGYTEQGCGWASLKCFEQMQMEGIAPVAVTLVCVLKACGSIGAIDKGRELHADLAQKGFERDVLVGSTLVDMYAKCGSLAEAIKVFDNLPVRNVVSWTALIAGYVEHGTCQEALKCFERMQLDGVSPNSVTFICILKACGSIGAIDKGRELHADIAQKGFERDVFVGSCLVDMYTRCGSHAEAKEVFDKLLVRDVVSWNALIAGHVEGGAGQEALKCFEQMQLEHVTPNIVTFLWALKACGSRRAVDKGQEIHSAIAQKRFESDVFVGSSLIDMYAKCGSLADAREVFDKMPLRNVVSWNTLITGYADQGPCQEALKCIEQMQLEGICPDDVTFVCVLKACASIGAIDMGRQIHIDITQKGFERDLSVGNTLVDMYAKCGSLLEAQDVFHKLPVRDIVSWNAMIRGFGLNHEGNMAVQCFDDMEEQGVKPNDITFSCLLTACSRARLVLKGQEFFNMMRDEHDIVPTADHYTCMVDLLAKSGHLSEAEKFLETMPCPPVWTVLLSACKIYGEAELGLRCFQQLVQMDPDSAAAYVLMAKIYASAGKWDDACRIEELRKHAGANKKPGSALIEVNNRMHEFVVGNNQSKEISSVLESLSLRMKDEGYVPSVNLVLSPTFVEPKETKLCEHAEKLTIAFGLINTSQTDSVYKL